MFHNRRDGAMRLETSRHLDDVEIEKYSRGETAEADVARMEEHLLICEHCQNRVTESDLFAESMAAASAQRRQQEKESKPPRWFALPGWMPAILVFGVAVILAVSAALWVGNRHPVQSGEVPFALSIAAVRG